MTIAACYLSSEGIVFGSDSTTTVTLTDPQNKLTTLHYDYGQKIFEIGEKSTLGLVTWGVAGLPGTSHRLLISQFNDELRRSGVSLPEVDQIAEQWSAFFWKQYSQAHAVQMQRAKELEANQARNTDEEDELLGLKQTYSGGFCLGGNVRQNRVPKAFEIVFSPEMDTPPPPNSLAVGRMSTWGMPNLLNRLLYGIDPGLYTDVLASGKWNGTDQDLLDLVRNHALQSITLLPIREAIDHVHSAIYTTIKMMRYSQIGRFCGGPVEIAIISADRQFRWVRHKAFDSAIC